MEDPVHLDKVLETAGWFVACLAFAGVGRWLDGRVSARAGRIYAAVGLALVCGAGTLLATAWVFVRGARGGDAFAPMLLGGLGSIAVGVGVFVGGMIWAIRSSDEPRKVRSIAVVLGLTASLLATIYVAMWGW